MNIITGETLDERENGFYVADYYVLPVICLFFQGLSLSVRSHNNLARKEYQEKKGMRLRLNGKFILITSLTLFLSIGLSTILNLGNTIQVYKEQVMESVYTRTFDMRTMIIELLEAGIILGEMDGINRFCTKIYKTLPDTRYCFIIDNQGKMLYRQEPDFANMVDIAALNSRIIKSREPLLIKYRLNKETLYDFSFPLINPSNEQKVGTIRIGTLSKTIDTETARMVRNSLLSGMIIIMAAGLIIFLIFHFRIIKLVQNLRHTMLRFGKGDWECRIAFKSSDELGEIAGSFNHMADNILELSEERKKNLLEMEKINQELSETRNALWGEKHLARKIQTILLPEKPAVDGFDICTHMIPMDQVGGDYYDVISVDNHLWLVIGDVSGHGISTGVIMMMAQTAIRTVLYQNPVISPHDLLSIINKTLNYNINKLKDNKYMTITVFACLDNAQFLYSGLHLPLLVYRAVPKTVEIIDTRGMWLGILKDIDHINKVDSITLNSGDVLLLYTDGIIEARNNKNQMFSLEKLIACFKENCKNTVDAIKESILAELENYETDDDVSLLIVKRK